MAGCNRPNMLLEVAIGVIYRNQNSPGGKFYTTQDRIQDIVGGYGVIFLGKQSHMAFELFGRCR